MSRLYGYRLALGSALLLAAGSGIVAGTGAARTAIQPPGTRAARAATGSMAAMPMAAPPTARPAGTVVALHRRLVRVTIHNFAFGPARLVVSPGTRIVWTNTDGDPHTVDSTKGLWSSEALDTGGRFARTFTAAGTFTYYCSVHPFMHGTIIVKK